MLAYVRGTPGFMAPEVCVGVHVTLDLFGAGNPGWGGGIDVMDSGGTDLAGKSPHCPAAHVDIGGVNVVATAVTSVGPVWHSFTESVKTWLAITQCTAVEAMRPFCSFRSWGREGGGGM